METDVDTLELEDMLDSSALCEVDHNNGADHMLAHLPTCAIVAMARMKDCDGEMILICRPTVEWLTETFRMVGAWCDRPSHQGGPACYQVFDL